MIRKLHQSSEAVLNKKITIRYFRKFIVFVAVCLLGYGTSAIAVPKRIKIEKIPFGKTVNVGVKVTKGKDSDGGTGTLTGGDNAKTNASNLVGFTYGGLTAKLDPLDKEFMIFTANPGFSEPEVKFYGQTIDDPAIGRITVSLGAVLPGAQETGFATLIITNAASMATGGQISFGDAFFTATVTTFPNELITDVFASLIGDLFAGGISAVQEANQLTIFNNQGFYFENTDPGISLNLEVGSSPIPEPVTCLLIAVGFIGLVRFNTLRRWRL